MNFQVEQKLKELKERKAEQDKQERDALLIAAGLYEEQQDMSSGSYRTKIYANAVTDEEYEAIKAAMSELREPKTYSKETTVNGVKKFALIFGFLCLIVSLFAAFSFGPPSSEYLKFLDNVERYPYSYSIEDFTGFKTAFSFPIFLISLAPSIMSIALFLSLGAIIDRQNDIINRLK